MLLFIPQYIMNRKVTCLHLLLLALGLFMGFIIGLEFPPPTSLSLPTRARIACVHHHTQLELGLDSESVRKQDPESQPMLLLDICRHLLEIDDHIWYGLN